MWLQMPQFLPLLEYRDRVTLSSTGTKQKMITEISTLLKEIYGNNCLLYT